MAYNKGGQGVREGNWVEEASLHALTGHTRYKLPTSTAKGGRKPLSATAIRVIAHSDSQPSSEWCSTNKSTLADPLRSKTYKKADFTGNRSKRWQKKQYNEVMEELEAEERREAKLKERGQFQTTAQASLTNPGTFGSIGKRVMKNQDGGAPCGHNEAFYESGMHARPAKMSAEALTAEVNNKYYLNDMPISIYTQRLLEGTFPGSRVQNPDRLFSRSTGFTNDIMDASKEHEGATDGSPGSLSSARQGRFAVEAAGGGLAVADVLSRILRGIEKVANGRSLQALTQIFRRIDTSGDQQVTRAELKAGLAKMRVLLTGSDLNVIFAHFDRDSSGKVKLSEFLRGCRGQPSRRRTMLVRSIFDELTRAGDGRVTLTALKSAFDGSRHPRVEAGDMTQDQARNSFNRYWQGMTSADGIVTLDAFSEYYVCVGASIESEEVFELMLRHTWHVEGGGQDTGGIGSAGCRRILVTYRDGRQSVEEMKSSIPSTDFDRMRAQLHRQGVHNVVAIEMRDGSKKTFQ